MRSTAKSFAVLIVGQELDGSEAIAPWSGHDEKIAL
jgi:hypothetical protein